MVRDNSEKSLNVSNRCLTQRCIIKMAPPSPINKVSLLLPQDIHLTIRLAPPVNNPKILAAKMGQEWNLSQRICGPISENVISILGRMILRDHKSRLMQTMIN